MIPPRTGIFAGVLVQVDQPRKSPCMDLFRERVTEPCVLGRVSMSGYPLRLRAKVRLSLFPTPFRNGVGLRPPGELAQVTAIPDAHAKNMNDAFGAWPSHSRSDVSATRQHAWLYRNRAVMYWFGCFDKRMLELCPAITVLVNSNQRLTRLVKSTTILTRFRRP